jgi:hypothetical protein
MTNDLNSITFKQFSKTLPGNYSINFIQALSGGLSSVVKNHTSFFLTPQKRLTDFVSKVYNTDKKSNISTRIAYGSEYLTFSSVDFTPYALGGVFRSYTDYGYPVFSEENSDIFSIELLENNQCRISYTSGEYKKYFLISDEFDRLSFVNVDIISLSSGYNNPCDFLLSYSESSKSVIFTKMTSTGVKLLTKTGEYLQLIPALPDSISDFINSSFALDTSILSLPTIDYGVGVVSYDTKFDKLSSSLPLEYNFLLYNNHQFDNVLDFLTLKNIFHPSESFSSSNNLLSSDESIFFSSGLRNYTGISNDIKCENDESLDLLYTFYNKEYLIKSGDNLFTSPSSMYPFSRLSIHDTKFIECGAFSSTTPLYSDRIYHISNQNQNKMGGQHLLCTWLSGSMFSNEKTWVDRYYYPDYISKENALSGLDILLPTYDDHIENLISSNEGLKSNIKITKIFDKKSDLYFEDNENYLYKRISESILSTNPTLADGCLYNNLDNVNYYEKINEIGKFTIAFKFKESNGDWVIESDRNLIDSGLRIIKNDQDLLITYKVYDYKTINYDDSGGSLYSYEGRVKLEKNSNNFVAVAVDSTTGFGYIIVNNDFIKTFNLPSYQITPKRLLYGDFFVIYNNLKENIFNSLVIDNLFLDSSYQDSELIYLVNNINKVDDITITLPCGMRNGTDSINLLQSLKPKVAKTNLFNIHIKNIDIDSNVSDNLDKYLTANLAEKLPVNTEINKVYFNNYK